MELSAVRRASRAGGFSAPPTARSDGDAIDYTTVLSTEEIELLRLRFALYSEQSTRRNKALSGPQASKLFRDDYPGLSEWELQEMLHKCDLNFDGQLSITEYLQARAFHRLQVEADTENEVFRSFTILDTDGDGVIIADEVLKLLEQSGFRSVGVLKQAITHAAAATKSAEQQQFHRQHGVPRCHRDGEITFEHFSHTIRMENRSMERDIAAKSLRLLSLQEELGQISDPLAANQTRALPKRLKEKQEVLLIEMDVLQNEISRAKRELLTDSNNPLGRVCENLVATYENEQYVYECLSNFITYCCLRDPRLFRFNLERSGKEVHVLDSVLMSPPAHITKSEEYARLTDLLLTSPPPTATALKPSSTATMTTLTTSNDEMVPHRPPLLAGSHHGALKAPNNLLLLNPTLRRQFVFYTTSVNVTNLETMTRSSFIKFVHDCDLHALASPPITEAELINIFATACGTSKLMTFKQWIVAIQLVLYRGFPEQCAKAEALEALVKTYVIARTNAIQTQNLAPDVSLTHVMKLLKEYIWQFKQIFFHFGVQSLVEVDSKVTVDMKEFLCFARAFGILRSTEERDGEPYSPPPMSESAVIQPISLMELVREFYAAKLDVSFSNPRRREATDLNFREFLRCILRISLAMHAHTPKKPGKHRSNGIVSTTFEALKEEEERIVERSYTPLFRRRGNVLGSSPTKTCKMTSTSIISKLLRTSRSLVGHREKKNSAPNAQGESPDISISHRDTSLPDRRSHSPTRIVYRSKSPDKRTPARSSKSPFSPVRPAIQQRTRSRPVSSGGPSIVRLVRPPSM